MEYLKTRSLGVNFLSGGPYLEEENRILEIQEILDSSYKVFLKEIKDRS